MTCKTDENLLQWSFARLFKEHPHARDFFSTLDLFNMDNKQTIDEFFNGLEIGKLEELGLDKTKLAGQLSAFIQQMDHLRQKTAAVSCVTVIGGHDKTGKPEKINLELCAGEVVSVVGPTGAGKSMLLSDIECLAQGDTPSGRKILVDNRVPDETERLSGEHRLVAQLSQNMNFVMDLPVRDFLLMHAESRFIADSQIIVEQILTTARQLAGEPFSPDTPVTALSGGQSRAVMIADVACLSPSPIVLIDEIENAGVDRRQALNLLVKKEKIVLMATHDPLLALSATRRIVIRNGGIASVMETTEHEQKVLRQLDAMDARLTLLRENIRMGKQVKSDTLLI